MSKNVEVLVPAPRALWREAVAADPTALLSHQPEWIDSICDVDGWTDASRLYRWPSGRILVLPMVRKRYAGFSIEQSLPAGWGYGGLAGAPEISREELAFVFADLNSRCVFRQRILPNCMQGMGWSDAIARRGWHVVAPMHIAHVVNLDGGIEAVWKRFSENARRGIRKAEKQGLEIECDVTGRSLDVFDQLWLLSVRRWANQRGEPAWIGRWRGRHLHPQRRWIEMIRRADGQIATMVARLHGQPVAAIVVLRGPNDHYTRGAMDKELAGPTRANFLLHWLAIQDACQRGARWYQMGRSGFGDDPVARFKENFGAQAHVLPEVHIDHVPIAYAKLVTRAALKGLIRTARRVNARIRSPAP